MRLVLLTGRSLVIALWRTVILWLIPRRCAMRLVIAGSTIVSMYVFRAHQFVWYRILIRGPVYLRTEYIYLIAMCFSLPWFFRILYSDTADRMAYSLSYIFDFWSGIKHTTYICVAIIDD